jgi:hypothetical protein
MVVTGATVGTSAAGGDPHATRRGSTTAIALRTKVVDTAGERLFRPPAYWLPEAWVTNIERSAVLSPVVPAST